MTELTIEYSLTVFSVGFLELLSLLFIALKLTGYISWSWWWVLAPLLITIAIFFVILFVFGILRLILWFFGGFWT